jgi:pilus assembly protein CpaB
LNRTEGFDTTASLMSRRILLIATCALILSICLSYLVYRAVSGRTPDGKAAATVQVVVAARDLAVGTLIREADLTTVAWPGALPKGTAAKRDDLLNRGVLSKIYGGEPVIESRLSPKGSGGGLAGIIPPGMRACAVKVNEVVGVAGFVVPGMRVDVLITGLPPGGNPLDGPKVRTLLQDIQVLSAGTDFQKDQEGKPQQAQVVNLLVTPTQAEILSLAGNETRIQLVLRNPMDSQVSQLPGTVMSDLFGSARSSDRIPPSPVLSEPPLKRPSASLPMPLPSIPPVAVPRIYTVEVSNGAVHTQAKFTQMPDKP